MLLLLFFAFLAGFVTILAPCIWPLLPIVLSASAGKGKRKPLGLTLGIISSFTIFTLSISYLEKIFHFNPNHFRLFAVIVICLLGVSMLIPAIGVYLESFFNRLLRPLQNKIKTEGNGFGAGFLTGFSVGVVWAPCAGPILATIATLAATRSVNWQVVLITLAYVIGLGIPLFFLSLFGARVFRRMQKVNKYTGRIQQVFGLIMIVAAVLIYTNYDKTLQVKILNALPAYGQIFERIENNETVTRELQKIRGEESRPVPNIVGKNGLPDLGTAPNLIGLAKWFNTDTALNLDQLKGKVVLIDFWTYSCINCIRTLPHVTSWYDRYRDDGLVVLGIHTPEFAFEKEPQNVQNAIKQFKINYPVALDNDYQTWRNFNNHYWPAKYLIDAKGRIRYTHFGEGEYAETEDVIRTLLIEAGQSVEKTKAAVADQTPQHRRTPETYLGEARAENFASNEPIEIGTQNFTVRPDLPLHHFAYEGQWNITEESGQGQTGSALEIHFQAAQVFLVISPQNQGDQIKVFLDGQPIDASAAGADVKDSVIKLDVERLYTIVDLKGKVEKHILRLELQSDGVQIYAFTFG